MAIKHDDGTFSRYLHLAEVGITKGTATNPTRVIAGTKLGIVGNTGTSSTGYHLHYDELASDYLTKRDIGRIYSWGAARTGTTDRTGYIYPNKCGTNFTKWSQVGVNTCTLKVGT